MKKEEVEKLLENDATPIYLLEKELGMPASTLQKALAGKRELPKKWALKLKLRFGNKLVTLDEVVADYDNRKNQLLNAARGRDKSGINEDELKRKAKGKSKAVKSKKKTLNMECGEPMVEVIEIKGVVKTYQEILRMAKDGATKDEIEAMIKANGKLTTAQVAMIMSKIKK